MEKTLDLQERVALIKEAILAHEETDPVAIATAVMKSSFVRPLGPEHHFLDGACFLKAFFNAGGNLDIHAALEEMEHRSALMPNAMCAYWGICGANASLGAALSILRHTTPETCSEEYEDNMRFTASLQAKIARLGGPSRCKRNAFLALVAATVFANDRYGVQMETSFPSCPYLDEPTFCIREKCPFYSKNAKE